MIPDDIPDTSAALIRPNRQTFTDTVEEHHNFAPGDSSTVTFLTYFDTRIQRNWAGPEHWKIQRPHLHRTLPSTAEVIRPVRAARKEFVLNFEVDYIEHSTIFQRTNSATISLSRGALEERSERDNLLPEDLHFSSSTLLQLFLRPGYNLGRGISLTRKLVTMPAEEQGEVEPAYWATERTGTDSAPIDNLPIVDNDDYDYYDESPIPTYYPAAVDSTQTTAIGDDLVDTARPTMAAAINYARKAKKVDVQELKRVLWSEIESIQSSNKKLKPETKFTSLIADLPSTKLSKETLADVSVPYCFICLLHLANEHDLKLTPVGDNDLLILRQ